MGFVEASRTGGILILTHRRNLVDQFNGELRDRGYADRACPPLLQDQNGDDATKHLGPVTVETYQWFVRNAGRDLRRVHDRHLRRGAHRAGREDVRRDPRVDRPDLHRHDGDRRADRPARHRPLPDADVALRPRAGRAPRRHRAAALHPHPPGPGVRTIAKVPLRRGEVDVEFDQELLAELLDQLPFNLAIADLYRTRFNGVPGVVYAAAAPRVQRRAGVPGRRDQGRGRSGETPKRELAEILARYEHGDIDVLVNAQLLAEGWNSPRATVCMHLAPTASSASTSSASAA